MKSNEMEKQTIRQLIYEQKPVTIFMVNGFQMHGIIKDNDDISIMIRCDGKNRLIYKCSISTIDY